MLGKRKRELQKKPKKWQQEEDSEELDELETKLLEGELSYKDLKKEGDEDEEDDIEYRKRRKMEEER